MKLNLPKCPVSMSMNNGLLILRCPKCKEVLYAAEGSPHNNTKRIIEEHVKKCPEILVEENNDKK